MDEIKETAFQELIRVFEKEYLIGIDYHQRLEINRKPVDVKNQTLQELNSYLLAIQQRREMRDYDIINNASGSVAGVIGEMWKSDKRLKSLYNTIKRYCLLREKDFNTIAVHVAEYRALSKLFHKIRLSVYRHPPKAKCPDRPEVNEIISHLTDVTPTGDIIVDKIHYYGKVIEKLSSHFEQKNEEELRQLFVAHLEAGFKSVVVSGETYNKNGKTDIIVKDNQGNNLFIGECKWWNGGTKFYKALDQVFDNYVTWRDTNIAFLFFVSNKDMTHVLRQIPGLVSKYALFIENKGCVDESRFTFTFKHRDDEMRVIHVNMVFFHYPR